MTNKRLFFTVLLLAAALTGCADNPAEVREDRAPLDFVVELAEDGPELAITFGLQGDGSLTEDSLAAYWQLTDAAGELRAESDSPALDAASIPDDGTTLEIMTWYGELEPGRYTLIWGVDGIGSRTVEFNVLESDGALLLGEVTNP